MYILMKFDLVCEWWSTFLLDMSRFMLQLFDYIVCGAFSHVGELIACHLQLFAHITLYH